MLRTTLAASALLALSACASTQIDAQWANPDYAGRSLRGSLVLVACEAQDATLQRICEDQVAAQISAMGGSARTSYSLDASARGAPAGTDPNVAAARQLGARAIVRTTLTTGAVVAAPAGPSIGIGVGGGGGRVGGFGGISFPIGGTAVSNAYASETVVIDPASGAIMWSARASAPASQDASGQVAELAKTAAGAMKQAGLF